MSKYSTLWVQLRDPASANIRWRTMETESWQPPQTHTHTHTREIQQKPKLSLEVHSTQLKACIDLQVFPFAPNFLLLFFFFFFSIMVVQKLLCRQWLVNTHSHWLKSSCSNGRGLACPKGSAYTVRGPHRTLCELAFLQGDSEMEGPGIELTLPWPCMASTPSSASSATASFTHFPRPEDLTGSGSLNFRQFVSWWKYLQNRIWWFICRSAPVLCLPWIKPGISL